MSWYGSSWRVDEGGEGISRDDQMLLYGPDPARWKPVVPFPGYPSHHPERSSGLYGVLAPSRSDVWTVGEWMNADTQAPGKPVIAHYNGRIWQGFTPAVPHGTGWLDALSGVPRAQTIWAVGGSDVYPLIERRG